MRFSIRDSILRKYEKESSRLRIGGGSWTIRREWISDPDIEIIEYETTKAVYFISRVEAIAKGFKRTFKGEDKLVVPIKFWTTLPK